MRPRELQCVQLATFVSRTVRPIGALDGEVRRWRSWNCSGSAFGSPAITSVNEVLHTDLTDKKFRRGAADAAVRAHYALSDAFRDSGPQFPRSKKGALQIQRLLRQLGQFEEFKRLRQLDQLEGFK
jgi:hypothetical protein